MYVLTATCCFKPKGFIDVFSRGIAKGSERKLDDISTKDAKFWAANRKKLDKHYPDEWIFIFNKEVFHDKVEDKALNALIKKYPKAVVSKRRWFSFTDEKKQEKNYYYIGKWVRHHSRTSNI